MSRSETNGCRFPSLLQSSTRGIAESDDARVTDLSPHVLSDQILEGSLNFPLYFFLDKFAASMGTNSIIAPSSTVSTSGLPRRKWRRLRR